jgi:hypothetical protein
MCLDYFSFKSLLWKVHDSKLDFWSFDFIKILAQIINKISKVRQFYFLFLNLGWNGKGPMVFEFSL